MQQCVYQMPFSVDEFKKQVTKSGLIRSRTLPTLLSTIRESISVPVFAQWADISNIVLQAVKNGQLDQLSVSESNRNVDKTRFCVLFRLSNNTALDKYVIFRWFCVSKVV